MTRSHENRCFRRFQQTRDPRLLGEVFDAVAPELLRVAGHLSNGDRELTQDALQATFLTAIEQQDRYDDTRDVRPWLLGILANHVRKERRRAVRSRGRPLDGEPEAAAATPSQQAERHEFGANAKHAMQRLPSPFREVIVLHLQHGLTAKEIGEALARPAGTVRTQVVRGMDKLRALLPAGFTAAALGMVLTPGPILAAVRQNVLASLPTVAVAGGSSSLALLSWRYVAMTMIGIGVVLSASLFPWSGDTPLPTDLESAAVEVETVDRAAEPQRPGELARELLDALRGKGNAPANRLGPRTQEVEFFVKYGRDGSPAANVPVGMRVNGQVLQWLTDTDGRARVELAWPGFYEANVLGTDAHSMWVWRDGERRKALHVVEMTIEPGMDLDLRVVDASGSPVAGATVEASHGRQLGTMFMPIGKTDQNGRFRRHDLAHRHGQVRAWASGFVPSACRSATARLGETCAVELKLPEVGLIARGRVVDENGQPLAGAAIALVQMQRRTRYPQFLTSGADGTFPLDTLHRGVSILVGQHLSDWRRRGLVRFTHDGSGEPQVELRLTRAAKVTGTLTDQAGNPFAGANIVARARPHGVSQLPFLETWTRTSADGSFQLDALVPGRYVLESDLVDDRPIELREGEHVIWNAVRKNQEPCTFRVLNALGQPLDGWSVSMIEPGESWPSSGAVLGPDGRIEYRPSGFAFPAGSYYRLGIHKKIGKREKAWKDTTRLPCLITPPLAVGVDHEIRVPANADSLHDLVGAVLDADGDPIGDAKVVLVGAFGELLRTEVGVDRRTGAFRFEDFPPGRYGGWVELPGQPSWPLPKINVSGERRHRFGDVVVPGLGRIRATVPPQIGTDGVRLEVVSDRGRAFALRRQRDGSWRSGKIHRGDYRLRGASQGARAVAQKITLDAAEARVDVAFAPHAATRVVVQLGPNYPTNANSFKATIRTAQQGRTTSSQRVSRSFCGSYQHRMEYLVQLPPGEQDVRVTCWRDRTGLGRVTVPPEGGGTVTVVIE